MNSTDRQNISRLLASLDAADASLLRKLLVEDRLGNYYGRAILGYSFILFLVLQWPFDQFYHPQVSSQLIFFDLPEGFISTQAMYLRDIISNTVYFLPFGFAWAGWRHSANRKSFWLGEAFLAGFLVSLFVEISQHWSISRHSSILDLATNTVGSGLGGLAYIKYLQFLRMDLEDVVVVPDDTSSE